MTIEVFGERLASVWHDLRPTTRRLVERALATQSSSNIVAKNKTSAATSSRRRKTKEAVRREPPSLARITPYDARAEVELCRLLVALDERLAEPDYDVRFDAVKRIELYRMTEACAAVLLAQAQSSEAFALLMERALDEDDFARIDDIADVMTEQLPVSELCELARHPSVEVSSLARETLAQVSPARLVEYVHDPVDAPLVREAIFTQAFEYGIEEAQWIVEAMSEDEAFGE